MLMNRKFICTACGHEWELPHALSSIQDICPACGREKVRRIDVGVRQQEFRMHGRPRNDAMSSAPENGRWNWPVLSGD
jgi:predicted RNA-binding Zn-ribbon protein involved in translation (DUF1610 family)